MTRRILALALALAVVFTTFGADTISLKASEYNVESTAEVTDENADTVSSDDSVTDDAIIEEEEEAQSSTAEPSDVATVEDTMADTDEDLSLSDVEVTVDVADEDDVKVVDYPAVDFEPVVVGDTTITISAPEGAFSEGVTVEVTAVDSEEAVAAVDAYDEATAVSADDLRVFDITFYDVDGNEVEPLVDINVHFEVENSSELFDVYHMEEGDEVAELVGEDLGSVVSDNMLGEVTIKTDEFSWYIIEEGKLSSHSSTYYVEKGKTIEVASDHQSSSKWSIDEGSSYISISSERGISMGTFWGAFGNWNGVSITVTGKEVGKAKIKHQYFNWKYTSESCTVYVYATPTGKSLSYNGTAQQLVNAGSVPSDLTILYSTDKNNWSSSIPTGKSAGTYTVYYKILNGNYEVTQNSVNATISKSAASVTAPTAISGLTYDGSAKALVKAGSTNFGTMEYSLDNSSWSTSVPTATNALDYIVYYRVNGSSDFDGASGSVNVSIAKATPTVTAPKSISSLVYNGAAQQLISAGTTNYGTIQYSLDNTNWTTDITKIAKTAAGDYTVYYRVVGTDNSYGVDAKTVSCKISKVNGTITSLPTAGADLVYTGEAQTLLATAATSNFGQVVYKLGKDGQWSSELPKATDAGDYTVYVKVAGDSNVNESATTEVSVSIEKAAGELTFEEKEGLSLSTIKNLVYGTTSETYVVKTNKSGGALSVSATGNEDGALTIETTANSVVLTASKKANDQEIVVTVTSAASKNYKEATATLYVKVVKGSLSIQEIRWTADTDNTNGVVYDGKSHTVSLIADTASDGSTPKVEYAITKIDGETLEEVQYSTELPSLVDAHTYEISYKVSQEGYKDYTGSQEFTISKASGDNTNTSVSLDGWNYGQTTLPSEAVASDVYDLTTATYTYYTKDEAGQLVAVSSFNKSSALPGTYYIKASFSATANYMEYTTEAAEFVIDGMPVAYYLVYQKADGSLDYETVGYGKITDNSVYSKYTKAFTGSGISLGTNETENAKAKAIADASTKPGEMEEYEDISYSRVCAANDATKGGFAAGKMVHIDFIINNTATLSVANGGWTFDYTPHEDAFSVEQSAVTQEVSYVYYDSNYNKLDSAPVNAGTYYVEAVLAPLSISKYSSATYEVYHETTTEKKAFTIATRDISKEVALSEISSKVYTGELIKLSDDDAFTVTATIDGKDYVLVEGSDYTLSYDNNLNAGTATVKVNFMGNFYPTYVEASFEITKAEGKIDTAPTANELTYNGENQALVTAGSSSTGTLYYSLDGEKYSEDIPTAKNAGTYTVYYKSVGDKNHEDTSAASVEVTIAKKENTLSLELESGKLVDKILQLVYGTDSATYAVASNESGAAITVSLSTEEEGKTASDMVEVKETLGKYVVTPKTVDGEVTITFTSAETDNYLSATEEIVVKVIKGKFSVKAKKTNKATYDGTAKTVSVVAEEATDGNTATIYYALVDEDGNVGEYSTSQPEMINAGTYTVAYKAVLAGYEDVEGRVQLIIKKANYTKDDYEAFVSGWTYGASEFDENLTLSNEKYEADSEDSDYSDVELSFTSNHGTSALKNGLPYYPATYKMTVTFPETANYNAKTISVSKKFKVDTQTAEFYLSAGTDGWIKYGEGKLKEDYYYSTEFAKTIDYTTTKAGYYNDKNVAADAAGYVSKIPSDVKKGIKNNDFSYSRIRYGRSENTLHIDFVVNNTVEVKSSSLKNITYDGTTDYVDDIVVSQLADKYNADGKEVSQEYTLNFYDENLNALDAAPVNAGTYFVEAVLTAEYDQENNYEAYPSITSDKVEFTIAKKEVSLSWSAVDGTGKNVQQSSNGKFEFTYSAKKNTVTATVNGIVEGDEVEVSKYSSNSKTKVGEYTAKATSLSNSNYKLPKEKTVNYTISYLKAEDATISATPFTTEGWYNQDIVLSLEGYSIADSVVNANTKWSSTLTRTGETDKGTISYQLKDADGYITDVKTITYKLDKTTPTATAAIGEDNILSTVYTWFNKDTVKIDVAVADNLSGIYSTKYTVLDVEDAIEENSEEVVEAVSDENAWEDYNSTTGILINANAYKYLLIEVVDKAGNKTVVTTDGIVVYTDSAVSTKEIEFTKLGEDDVDALVTLNGNTIKNVTISDLDEDMAQPELGKDVIVDNNKLTFKADYLQTLKAYTDEADEREYTVVVSYNAFGVASDENSKGSQPGDTTIKLVVARADDSVAITNTAALVKTYDGTATAITYDVNSTSEPTITYVGTDTTGAAYESTIAPTNAGTYTVTIEVPADENYVGSTDSYTYTIARRPVDLVWTTTTAFPYDAGVTYGVYATVTNVVDGDVVNPIYTGTHESMNVGSYSTTVYAVDNMNYILSTPSTRAWTLTMNAPFPNFNATRTTASTTTTDTDDNQTVVATPAPVANAAGGAAVVADNNDNGVEIEDNETPLAVEDEEDTTSIEDEEVPESVEDIICNIHWIILILTIVFALYTAVMTYLRKREYSSKN